MTQVDAFLDDLDRLAAAAAVETPDRFYGQLLPAVSAALGADAAVFEPPAAAADSWPAQSWSEGGGASAGLLTLAQRDRVDAGGGPRIEAASRDGAALAACPVMGPAETAGVLSFRLSAVGASDVGRSLELVAAVAEVASRFELRRAAAAVADQRERLTTVEGVLLRMHSRRGIESLADELADSGPGLIGCDRLAVLHRVGGRCRVLAVSGVRRVSRRSDAARRMVRLGEHCLRLGLSIAYPLDPTLADRVSDEQLDRYSDATGVRSLLLVPCQHDEGAAELALLAEWYDDDRNAEAERLLAALARHAAVAAQREGRSWRSWLSLGRVVAGVLALATLAAATLVLALAPATLWVSVEGRFERAERARVFAPLEGVVEQLFVAEGDRVNEGQPLLRLASAELRLKQEEVAETIATTNAEIAVLETAELRATLPERDDEADPASIAGRLAALREALQYQHAREELLHEQAARLTIVSPIDGVIVSWRPEDALSDRPVVRGQRLLDVAAEGAWRLELDVPDHRSGHIVRAGARDLAPRVEYVVRADPSVTHLATVAQIADATHADGQGQPVVRVLATPEDAQRANPRGGLGVSAKIDCGEHSLGYVWLHEAIDAIRRRWF